MNSEKGTIPPSFSLEMTELYKRKSVSGHGISLNVSSVKSGVTCDY